MSDHSGIEWTEATWNPVVGCTPVSAGCLNCYAARMARRLEAMGQNDYLPRIEFVARSECHRCGGTGHDPGHGRCGDCNGADPFARVIRVAQQRDGRAIFTGEVRCLPDKLTVPMRWRKPRRIFVNSMSDLFHEAVPFDFIDRVFAVMALCPQHTFQCLSKRPERMAEYVSRGFVGVATAISAGSVDGVFGRLNDMPRLKVKLDDRGGWPPTNVWLGTSVETQPFADERIPHLLRCPAAVRFLSIEPLLGPVDLTTIVEPGVTTDCLGGVYWANTPQRNRITDDPIGCTYEAIIHWVIVGCESGPGARNHDGYEACARSVIERCRYAGVPVFHKQMPIRPGSRWRVSGDPAEWPADLRVRQWPRGYKPTGDAI